MERKKKGKAAYIDLKLNNLADPDIVGLLYQAADAGVRLRLNVRGMYSLIPDQVQRRENIEAIGLIDRYLEHSRVFVFANGGNEKIFLSSGDLMIRNLERRVEVTFPVYDPALREEIKEFMEIQFRDNVKARILDQELSNKYRPREGEAIRCQAAFHELLRSRVSREEETPEPRAIHVTG